MGFSLSQILTGMEGRQRDGTLEFRDPSLAGEIHFRVLRESKVFLFVFWVF